MFVGGFVRDALLGQLSHDLDIEVFGINASTLEHLLAATSFQINFVGRSFGIYKVRVDHGVGFDVAIPRRESKTAQGHKGFHIEGDPSMSFAEAARRRDFTVNAISYDPLTDELIDPFFGQHDLHHRLLRVVDPYHFQEDPLRVYRAMQFVARFGLDTEPQTLALMRQMVTRGDLEELAPERIVEEWRKLLLRATRPSRGFELLRALGVIERSYPELYALIGTPQEPAWHPEGDVWIHTMMVIDQAAKIVRREALASREALGVMLGALCHDLGKPSTTEFIEGRIRSHGHEDAGVEPVHELFRHIPFSHELQAITERLTVDHLKPGTLLRLLEQGKMGYEQYLNSVRRLLKRIAPATWQMLLAVAEADARGRGFEDAETAPFAAGEALRNAVLSHELDQQARTPLVQGRDLLALGFTPGRALGELIERIEMWRDQGIVQTKKEALERLRREF